MVEKMYDVRGKRCQAKNCIRQPGFGDPVSQRGSKDVTVQYAYILLIGVRRILPAPMVEMPYFEFRCSSERVRKRKILGAVIRSIHDRSELYPRNTPLDDRSTS